ncbi:dockerin type I repeat-containing protein [Ruminococcus sp.]|uniref:dockerin type I repeat-containing protein n=1 Tax=Ruminococcus sp. TaxID=41978 RepID=UPI0034544145|nr:dockerin type I repeat-containing protein [Ruminococcus sp.]
MKRKILALALAAMCLGSAAAANVTPGAVIAAEGDTAQTTKDMTLDDVKELAKKGKKLDWTDFSDYNIKWRSTIAYTRFCKVELGSEFFLVVGGEPNLRPDVVWLCYSDTENYVDVKTGDVGAFISKYAKTDTVSTTTTAKPVTTTTTAKTTTTTAKTTTTTAATTIPKTSYKLISPPDKVEYKLGEGIDLTGIKIEMTVGDQTPVIYTYPDVAFEYQSNIPKSPTITLYSDFRSDKAGTYKVAVTGADDVNFTVNVVDDSAIKDIAVFEEGENMTLDDVIELSRKGNALTLKDFVKYKGVIAGSGIFILEYDLGNGYTLTVGSIEHYDIAYARLRHSGSNNYIDIRTDDVEKFISASAEASDIKGDANCDGQMDMADVVLIMQAMANPNKYGIDGTAEHHLTEQGKINSDMDGNGLTVGDALAIQRKLLGIEECEKLTIKLNTLIPQNGSEYVEMEPYNAMVSSYDVSLSSLNGVGVWFEFESPSYPITLTTKNGSFKTFTYNGGGLGTINDEGSTYKLDKSGSVSFVPETVSIPDDYKAEVMITGEENGKTVDLGTLVITKNDKNTKGVLSVTFKKAGSASLAGKKFYYEKEGFGGYCNIEFNEDGTFLYSPGVLSSYLGGGTWKISGDTVILTEKNEGEGKTITNRFKIAGNDIVYIADGSDGLRYMEVKDGEKFSITAADTSDLEKIRQQLSDFFTAEKIDYSVIPRDKMPAQFADKYVFIKVNTADTSYAARYGAFLKSSDIDSSLIKSISYKIDSDTELNKIRALLYCYILENNINASVDPTDEEADLKNKTVLVKYADSEKTRTQLENFLKEKNIDLNLVEFLAVE